MFRRCFGVIAFLLGAVISSPSFGQTPPYPVEIIPNNPTIFTSPISVWVREQLCIGGTSVTYPTPSIVRIDFLPGVCHQPFPPLIVPIGTLSAGTYTVEVYKSLLPVGTATFVVSAAPLDRGPVVVVGINPTLPKAYEPVNLHYITRECGFGRARVEHVGEEFVVTMLQQGVAGWPGEVCVDYGSPYSWDVEVRIGTFPPGSYTVSIVSEAGAPYPIVDPQRITFTVGSQPASMTNKPLADFSGHWWNPSESGWGLSVHQSATDQVFIAFYHYDASNRPVWYVAPGGKWSTNFWWEGTLYRTNGPPLGSATFDPALVTRTPVGYARLNFLNGFGRAFFMYEIDGVTFRKSVERLPF